MTNISFTSTYRIPISQPGINAAKKIKLREIVVPYQNKLVSKNNSGTVRLSIPQKEDAKFIKNLKSIGYKIFQKFEGEEIPQGKLDNYIKSRLTLGEYNQIGKQKKRLSTAAKQKRQAAIALKEKREEEKLIAEAIEEVRKAKMEKRKINYLDSYETDFDFDKYEAI